MRTLLTLLTVAILILAAGSALAESNRQDLDPTALYQPRNPLLAWRGTPP